MSESTNKLELLTDCVNRIPDEIKRRVKSVKLVWVEIGDIQFDGVAAPNVEIELYPSESVSRSVAFDTSKSL